MLVFKWVKVASANISVFSFDPSGQAVQSLVVFQTSEALQWLGVNGAASLLERTGLAQAVHQGEMFRSCRITNITVGGEQTHH